MFFFLPQRVAFTRKSIFLNYQSFFCISGRSFFSGMDCFADDREALNDFAKYFNNAHLSDVTLLVGDEMFVFFF